MKVLGYRLNDKVYGVATHLGGVYISRSEINVYYDEKSLKDDYAKAVKYVTGRMFWGSTDLSVPAEYRGGKVFITNLRGPRCEFKIPKLKGFSDTSKRLSLRNSYKLKDKSLEPEPFKNEDSKNKD